MENKATELVSAEQLQAAREYADALIARGAILTLKEATYATQIHGKTGQEIVDLKLPAGTRYEMVSRHTDVNGWRWLRISVDGDWFDVQCPYSHLFTDECNHTASYEG